VKFDTYDQLIKAGYSKHAKSIFVEGKTVTGTFDLEIIPLLEADERFANGPLHGLHADVGEDRTDFRSYRGTLGEGSLQLVIDRKTGRFYADIDEWNPYADVVNWVGHAFGEVVPHFFAKFWRKKKKIDKPEKS